MKILLDTQLILWWQGNATVISAETRGLVESADEVFVSFASVWEIAIKISIGKLQIKLPQFCRQVDADGFTWLPIERAHLLDVATLSVFADHKDPFDRLLVAQSLVDSLTLLTTDQKLTRYGSTIRLV